MQERTCCFFGHRTIRETDELRASVADTIERLIVDEKVDTFLFGSKSEFDRLCLALVTGLKEKYPHVKRIYVRAEYPFINESYTAYLLKSYDETYYPEKLHGAGRAAYVERNYEMIEKSKYCIVYYEEGHVPTTRKSGTKIAPATRKSGTKIALEYAVKKGREIRSFPE
jgi:uncharacterized phage-like protein YoqJ